jgi:O-antigen ligase
MTADGSAWEDSLAAWALTVAAALLPVAAVFAPLGVAPLGAATGLATLPQLLRRRSWRRVDWPLAAGPLLLCLWALISAAWALDPTQAVKGAAKLATTAVLGAATVTAAMAVTAGQRRRIGQALSVATAAMVVVLTLDYAIHLSVTHAVLALKGDPMVGQKSHLNRGATVVAIVAWPIALLLAGRLRTLPTVLLTGVAMLLLLLSDSTSTRLAVLAAAAMAGAMAVAPRLALRALAVLVVMMAVALPTAMREVPPPQHTLQNWTWVPNSAHHRLTIWSFTAQRIAEHPWRGWGMDASRTMPGADDEVRLKRIAPDGSVAVEVIESMLPLHPHNAVMQVWLELGLPGVAALVAFLLVLMRRIDRLEGRLPRGAAAAVLAGTFCVSVVSYGFWQSWWQTALWLTAAFLVLALHKPAGSNPAG